MTVKKTLGLLLGLLGLSALAGNALSEAPRWYQVEVLVYLNEPLQGNELWPEVSIHQAPGQSVRLNGSDSSAYRTLASKPAFDRYLKALAGDGKQVVFHEAWRQPARPRSEMPYIQIRGGNRYGNRSELEGYLKISAQRYLHIDSDLWWNRFEPGGQDIDLSLIDPGLPRYGVGQNFHFKQSRRMRSNETHYLDSPVLGLLVRVTPLD